MTYKSITEMLNIFKEKYPIRYSIIDYYKKYKQKELPKLEEIDKELDIEFGSFVPLTYVSMRTFCFKTKEDRDKFIKYITEYKNKT